MPRNKNELKNITHLGSGKTDYLSTYSPNVLEAFCNKHEGSDYMVELICTEFTSLCPKTGQPDFATIEIKYVPDKLLVESKSLKLYLFSFRNHGDFHEDCINIICKDLVKLLNPKYIEVIGKFVPRGGIAIYPKANWAKDDSKYNENFLQKRLFDIK